jgi:hypothetical protein
VADVFISYVKKEGALAAEVSGALEHGRFTSWLFERDGDVPGPSYATDIVAALTVSKVLLVLISSASMESHQICREVEFAHNHKKRFLPILVDVTLEQMRLRRPDWDWMFGTAVIIHLSENRKEDLEKIVRGLRTLMPVAAPALANAAVALSGTMPSPSADDSEKSENVKIDRRFFAVGFLVTAGVALAAIGVLAGLSYRAADLAYSWLENLETTELATSAFLIKHATFNPDGDRVAMGNLEGVGLWDTFSGSKLARNYETAQAVTFLANGRHAEISADTDDLKNNGVTILDAAGKSTKLALPAPLTSVDLVAFSHDSSRVAVVAENGSIGFWDSNTGRKLLGEIPALGKYGPSISFFPDDARVLTFCQKAGLVTWDARTFQRLISIPSEACGAAISPDGKQIASVDLYQIELWDAASGKKIREMQSGGLMLGGVTFSPDGRWIAAGRTDGIVNLWDAKTGLVVKRFGHTWGAIELLGYTWGEHRDAVKELAFAPDSKSLLILWSDRRPRIWKFRN